MGVFLGLSAAFSWGVADFLARFAARRVGAYRTLFFMQLFGFLGLSVYLSLARGTLRMGELALHMSGGSWTWMIAAALLNVAATLALYRAFETGVLAVVAPVASSYPVLTILLDSWSGERLTVTRWVGLIAALVGVLLAATPRLGKQVADGSGAKTRQPVARTRLATGVGWAIFASAGFGVMFWLLGFRVTPVMGGVAPIWIFRVVALLTLAAASRPARQPLRLPDARAWWLLAGTGGLDTSAFVLTCVGMTTEQVSVVTVLCSLFGAVTVGLAWVFLREPLHWTQWLGIFLIFVGIVLVMA